MVESQGEEEPAQALLQAAAKAGFHVTPTQLRDWRQGGLLPSPRQTGRGRGRGTETVYPAGATEQLLVLCELRKKRRSLDDACWGLWWRGYRVGESRIRRLFEEQAAFPTALRDRWERDEEATERDDEEDFAAIIEATARRRLDDPFARLMRKRVGSEAFPTLLVILSKLGSGIDADLFEEDSEMLAAAFGGGDSSDVVASLSEISRALDPRELSAALNAASIQDLEAARDEVRSFFEFAQETLALIELFMSREVAAPPLELFHDPQPDYGLHVILFWLQLRRSQQVRELLAKSLKVLSHLRQGDLTASEALERDL